MSTVRELNLACQERDTLIVLADIRRQQCLELQKQVADLEEFSTSQEKTTDNMLERIDSIAVVHARGKLGVSTTTNLNAIEARLNELARQVAELCDLNESLKRQLIEARDNSDHEVEP